MSALHCPALVLLVAPDVEGTAALAARLRDARVARVCAVGEAAAATAGDLADALGVDLVLRDGPLYDLVDEVADQHRGETVLVVSGEVPTADGLVALEVDETGRRRVSPDRAARG